MPECLVEWRINIDADTPEDAARQARAHQIRSGTTAVVFHVTTEDGTTHTVDLLEADNPDH
ncbi:hypothetical protein [Alteromonas macleodii]|uniref:Uncharacterized protein n=1 Tax=Alteromonas macleodii TaxID=28108 RepID=A0AB36FMP5_ALTMA|nr:hypothetical protein [Alteromonas macleodii]OES24502.1 hypothetical protein BFV95_4769 [Alteromonas macleodii]OES25559.1 hypothetical protein BFV94_4412 [Alteromonas macleodii]OES25860.1 hypothetical protein BFV93_4323 [Alteromonas macleodii]OES38618.1 hypothetical protein BFV96_4729 [Alteromonas macleodii]